MKPLHIRIVEDFKPGKELTTKNIREIYAASLDQAKTAIDFLKRIDAIRATGRKDAHFIIYAVQKNAYEKTVKEEKRCEEFRHGKNKRGQYGVKELAKTHNPLILKFDELLAGARL
ncbi:hypothetical protein M2263_001210 [Providencia alcalifaciens]|nr:hypothetical protein [Providencia alcalifaciens]